MRFGTILASIFCKKKKYIIPFDLSESSYFEEITPNPMILTHDVAASDVLEFAVAFFEEVPQEELEKKAWEFYVVDVDKYGNEHRVFTKSLTYSVDIAQKKLSVSGIYGWKNTMKFYCVDKMDPGDTGSSGAGEEEFDWNSDTTIVGNTEWTRYDLTHHDGALWYGSTKLMDVSDSSGIYSTDERRNYDEHVNPKVTHDGDVQTTLSIAAIRRLLLNNPLPGGWRVSTLSDWIHLFRDGFGYSPGEGNYVLFWVNNGGQEAYGMHFQQASEITLPNSYDSSGYNGAYAAKCNKDIMSREYTLTDSYSGRQVKCKDRLHTSFRGTKMGWFNTQNDITGDRGIILLKDYYPYQIEYFVSAIGIKSTGTQTRATAYSDDENGFTTFRGGDKNSYAEKNDMHHLFFTASYNYALDNAWWFTLNNYTTDLENGGTWRATHSPNGGGADIDIDNMYYSIRLCRDVT